MRRPAEAQEITPLVMAQLQARQQVTPERLTADFDFQVEVLHTTIRELIFDCDPSLQPYDVSIRNVDLQDWEFKEAKEGERRGVSPPVQEPATLVIHLREPFQGTLQGLKIHCLAPRPADKPWSSPTIRLRQAQTRGENLKIAINPDVQLEAWDAAGFRLVSSTTDSDGSQILALIDPAIGVGTSRRPSGQFKSRGFELITRQQNWWQIGPKEMLLAGDISYELVRGSLFQLRVKLPEPGSLWRVKDVQLEPMEAMRSWAVTGPLLLVDLKSGLKPQLPGQTFGSVGHDSPGHSSGTANYRLSRAGTPGCLRF